MKIGIINDALIAVESMRRILTATPQHTIIWVARNGAEGVKLCASHKPDLILMDMIMPVMGGVEATRQIMKNSPCAILIVTSTIKSNSAKVFEAMSAGALDVMITPGFGSNGDSGEAKALLEKINRIGILIGDSGCLVTSRVVPKERIFDPLVSQDTLVAIGSSTGGPQALVQILSALPGDFPAPIVVVQHMDVQFTSGLVEWINSKINLSTRVILEGDRPQAGKVLIPSTTGHLVLTPRWTLSYSQEPTNISYHPSVDVFFQSVARNWAGQVIAVLLTGMGRDGAEGLLAIRQRGWHTIAQDEASSIVYGMPKAAVELGAAKDILPLNKIGPAIIDLLAKGKSDSNGTARQHN